MQGSVASWEKESYLMCYSEHAGKAEQLDVLFWVQVRGAVLLGAGCSAFRSCADEGTESHLHLVRTGVALKKGIFLALISE